MSATLAQSIAWDQKPRAEKLASAGIKQLPASITINRCVSFHGVETYLHEARYGHYTQTFETAAEAKRWIQDRHTEWLISNITRISAP